MDVRVHSPPPLSEILLRPADRPSLVVLPQPVSLSRRLSRFEKCAVLLCCVAGAFVRCLMHVCILPSWTARPNTPTPCSVDAFSCLCFVMRIKPKEGERLWARCACVPEGATCWRASLS